MDNEERDNELLTIEVLLGILGEHTFDEQARILEYLNRRIHTVNYLGRGIEVQGSTISISSGYKGDL